MRRLLLVPPDALPARDVFGRDLHPRDYRRYLGQTRSALAWDASGGLYPNAFAALAATLGDGHDLPLYLPEHYPDGDPDHLRLLDYGEAVAACRDHFNARLRRLIHANAAPQTAPPPDTIEHRHQPQIILGRRGRGKTTRLAAKIRWLGGTRRIVRIMPNTPAQVGQGVAGLFADSGASAADRELADCIMRTSGQTLWLDSEDGLHRITGISGSGPAYVFYLLEALQNAARQQGFNAEEARQLSLATFQGAVRLAEQSGEEFSDLRQKVTSKGGTTYAALQAFEAHGVADAIGAGVAACVARSQELAEQLAE